MLAQRVFKTKRRRHYDFRAAIPLICILVITSPAAGEDMETQHRGGMRGGGVLEGIGAGLAAGAILNGIAHAKNPSDQDDAGRPSRKRASTSNGAPKRHAKKPDPKKGTEAGGPKKDVSPPVLTDDQPKVPDGPPAADKPKDSDPTPRGTTTDTGEGTAHAPPPEALTKCCSCLDQLTLTYLGIGPKTTPDTLVDVSDEEAGNYKKVKSLPPMPSHKFQVKIIFHTIKSKDQGNLTLKWFEKSDRVPTASSLAGQQPGQWADQQDLLTNSKIPVNKNTGKPATPADKEKDITTFGEFVLKHGGTATNWVERYQKNKANACRANSEADSVYIEDEPAAAQPRKLEFHIVVESPKNCNCPTAALELYATQILAADPKEKDPAKAGKASQGTANSGLYGPQGKLEQRGSTIKGVPPAAPQPMVPAQ